MRDWAAEHLRDRLEPIWPEPPEHPLAALWRRLADGFQARAADESDERTAAHLRGQAAGLRLAARQLEDEG